MLASEGGEYKDMISACEQVVSNCSLEEIDVSKLAVFDLQHLFMRLKEKSTGETQDFTLVCGGCKETMNYTLQLSDVKVQGLDERPDSIIKIQNDIVKDNKEFKNLDADDKEVVLQDITQVVRGIIRKNTVKKVSIINGKIVTDDIGSKEVMQKNPVFDYLDSLGMDYAIFDNNYTRRLHR